MLARIAERLVRLPLLLAGAVVALLVFDAIGLPGAFRAARIGVGLLLASYLLAGLANISRFPRAIRGPRTAIAADCVLLDLWTCVGAFVCLAAVADRSCSGLL